MSCPLYLLMSYLTVEDLPPYPCAGVCSQNISKAGQQLNDYRVDFIGFTQQGLNATT